MIPILAKTAMRYWLRYWQGPRVDTGRRFDTGSRYWLPILAGIALAFSILACSISPSWVPSPTSEPTGTADPTPERAPQSPRLKGTAAPAPGPIRETVSAIEALNVRQEASEKSPSLGTLLHGAEVELTGICSDPPGWAEIRYKSGRAWVKARYITGDLCEAE